MAQSLNGTRPALPSLHSLRLPTPPPPHELNALPSQHDIDAPQSMTPGIRSRQSSTSSTTTASSCPSRSSSPCDSMDVEMDSPSPAISWQHPCIPSPNFTLVTSSFEDADALVFVGIPLPSKQTGGLRRNSFLVVGPPMEHMRNRRHLLRKEARLHPYKMVPVLDRHSRRTSSSSSTSTTMSVDSDI